MGKEDESSLEFTPTWVVAVVCTIIITISLLVERCIHYGGQYLKRKNQKPLYEALQTIKEELMLLGFISLLLTVLQGSISKICIPKRFVKAMLPCERKESSGESTVEHVGRLSRMLSEMEVSQHEYCAGKGKDKVPFLSVEALHHLHIFIFVLAVVHVTFSVLTIVFGGARIRQWKQWEEAVAKDNNDSSRDGGIEQALRPKVTHVREHAFIQQHSGGVDGQLTIVGWVKSLFKQFYAAVTKVDYVELRFGFIMTHCKSNPKFDFHKYMIRALEDDFKHVVGISWYLWVFVVIFLLVNVNGWHTYFWIAFVPFILLLAVGTKLEHVITQLATEVSDKHTAIEGDLVVTPSDEHFWFNRPQLILFFIHFILFQNAFEIAFIFWIWVQFGFDSCIMGQSTYIIPRLIIGVIIQVLCSYSTLPLYALVTQMGSTFKKAIFDEHIHAGLRVWHAKAQNKKRNMRGAGNDGSTTSNSDGSVSIQLGRLAPARQQNSEGNEGSTGST